jgi:hypothetical protein
VPVPLKDRKKRCKLQKSLVLQYIIKVNNFKQKIRVSGFVAEKNGTIAEKVGLIAEKDTF